MLFSLKEAKINEAYNQSVPKRNTKPVLTEKKNYLLEDSTQDYNKVITAIFTNNFKWQCPVG